MKTLKFLAALVIFIFASVLPVWSDGVNTVTIDSNRFLSENFGWSIDFPEQKENTLFHWEMRCDLLKFNYIGDFKRLCYQKDPRYYTSIFWRKIEPEAIEEKVFHEMAGSQKAYTAECIRKEKILPNNGEIRDYKITLRNGTFFASFYHFELGNIFYEPAEIEESDKYMCKNKNTLPFTISVQNASPRGSSPKVSEKIRELVSFIRFSR
jgi:hypothetical protein